MAAPPAALPPRSQGARRAARTRLFDTQPVEVRRVHELAPFRLDERFIERRLREEGYFRPEPIVRMWRTHLSGALNEQYRLWSVLMFQSWLEANNGSIASTASMAPSTAA